LPSDNDEGSVDVSTLQMPSTDHRTFDEICAPLDEWDHLPAVKGEPPEVEEEPFEDEDASLDGMILAGIVSPY
jgi:hypothetical protein